MHILGIDIGGSGIKGAPVDTDAGKLLAERFRLDTPVGAKPADVAATVAEVVKQFNWTGPVGCGFPAVIQKGVAQTASNVDQSWIGTNADKLFERATKLKFTVINDADAAGLAEMRFGAGRGNDGVVLMVTVGTGIGSALFTRGLLVPNTEFGQVDMGGKIAERRVSDAARQRKDLTWKEWAKRFNVYLQMMESYLYPDLIIIGGGASKEWKVFAEHLETRAKTVPAKLLNEAGTIGAALASDALVTSSAVLK